MPTSKKDPLARRVKDERETVNGIHKACRRLGKAVYLLKASPKAKAGSDTQPITRHLADYLTWHLRHQCVEGQVWLFPSSKSKTGHTVNIVKAYKRIVKAAGLNPDEIVRHTMRHTAITHLVQSGVDLPTVKKISRHKTTSMVEKYSHQNSEHIRAALDKLEERYQNKPVMEVVRGY